MFLDRGMENDMRMLDISCYLCRWTGLFKYYQVTSIYIDLFY